MPPTQVLVGLIRTNIKFDRTLKNASLEPLRPSQRHLGPPAPSPSGGRRPPPPRRPAREGRQRRAAHLPRSLLDGHLNGAPPASPPGAGRGAPTRRGVGVAPRRRRLVGRWLGVRDEIDEAEHVALKLDEPRGLFVYSAVAPPTPTANAAPVD